jgi:hypothetical protein
MSPDASRHRALTGWATFQVLALSLGAASAAAVARPDESWWQKKFVDPEDGRLDASEFLASAYGFVPIAAIITDPAVGYGASLGLIFLRPDEASGSGGKPGRPDISALGGFGTENGSWGAGLGDSSTWRNGTLKTLAGAFDVDANLELFGPGDVPFGYNLRAWGTLAEANTRIRASNTWLGLRYVFANVGVGFAGAEPPPGIDPRDRSSDLSGLTPIVTYDSRDNVFTPTKGLYGAGSIEVFNDVLGSDRDFEILSLNGMWFRPLGHDLTLGVKTDVSASFDDVPFYLRPYVKLRGIQSLRLQAANVADAEVELRWQPWSRYSLVAFAGGGIGWKGRADEERSVATGGIGFRYYAARRFGLHLGLDVGFGPDDPILYFQFGHAWFRP